MQRWHRRWRSSTGTRASWWRAAPVSWASHSWRSFCAAVRTSRVFTCSLDPRRARMHRTGFRRLQRTPWVEYLYVGHVALHAHLRAFCKSLYIYIFFAISSRDAGFLVATRIYVLWRLSELYTAVFINVYLSWLRLLLIQGVYCDARVCLLRFLYITFSSRVQRLIFEDFEFLSH